LANEPNDVNCLNSRAIIEYIRRHYPERLQELFSNLPSPFSSMSQPDDFLSDENNWIPSSIVVTLFEKAKQITGNPRTPYDIGFESITHRDLSYVAKVFLTFFSSPRRILRRMNQLNSKLNMTKTIQLLENAPGHALLRWNWRPGVKSSHDVCDYNRGIYSAVPTLWGYAPAKVTEDPCTFRGGDFCQISISWGFSAGKVLRLLQRIFTRGKLLRDIQDQVDQDKAELRQKVEILKAINEATRTLILTKSTNQVLEQTLRPIIEVLGFHPPLIMTEDAKREVLEFRHGQVGPDEDLERLKRYRIPLSRMENLMVRVYHSGQAEMSQDPLSMGLNPQNPILRDFHPGPSIVCPLDAGGRTVGILGVTRRDPVRPLKESDKEYVSIFANNIATAFERARLDLDLKQSYEERVRIEKEAYEERARIEQRRSDELRQSYEGAVRALVKAIEVNDEDTGDHSDRVSKISEKLARQLGYSGSKLDDIRFGCILHDVGKIGLASYLELRKPGPLTPEEYERIKEHPVRGEDILKANLFFDRYRTIVRNHHERWDGKGYPDGLKAEQIPLEAQIVAIADAYDAMTSDRRYRKALHPAQAMAEILKCSGTQFSPTTVEAFLQLYAAKEINGKVENS